MSNKKTVPSLRFRGFSEPWEEKEFNEIFYYSIPNNTLSRAELSYEDGSVYNVHYGDVLIKYGSILDIQCDKIPRIPNKNSSDFKGALLQDGDIIIADTAEDETVGKVCEISNLQDSNVVSGLHTLAFRANDKMALGYLGYYLNSEAYHRQFLPLMQGIKVLSLSKSNIQKTIVRYSGSKNEQKQLADYFRNLDHLITLEQRKYDKLNTVKKSMLEKMFPQKGAKVPEIRFKGFTEPWEEKKLGEICTEIIAGGDVDKEMLEQQGKYPVIANALTNDGIVGFYENEYRVKAPAVTITGRGDVGHAKARKVDFTPVVRLLTIKTNHDVDFMENIINTLKIMVESTGVPQLTVPQVARYELFVPQTVEEEKRIGSYFQNLDRLITLQNRKIEKLRNLKKACLEKMFV